MSNYDQFRKDHEYLWETYGPADDMTGGYVDSEDLERLLKTPTKVMAAKCYADQIRYWFDAGPDTFGKEVGDWRSDPEVRLIAERHGTLEALEAEEG